MLSLAMRSASRVWKASRKAALKIGQVDGGLPEASWARHQALAASLRKDSAWRTACAVSRGSQEGEVKCHLVQPLGCCATAAVTWNPVWLGWLGW